MDDKPKTVKPDEVTGPGVEPALDPFVLEFEWFPPHERRHLCHVIPVTRQANEPIGDFLGIKVVERDDEGTRQHGFYFESTDGKRYYPPKH